MNPHSLKPIPAAPLLLLFWAALGTAAAAQIPFGTLANSPAAARAEVAEQLFRDNAAPNDNDFVSLIQFADAAEADLRQQTKSPLAAPLAAYWRAVSATLAMALAKEKSASATVAFQMYGDIAGPLEPLATPASTPDAVQTAFAALQKVLTAEAACYLGPRDARYVALCIKDIDYKPLTIDATAVTTAAAAATPPLTGSPVAAFYAALAESAMGPPLSIPPTGETPPGSLPTFQGLIGLNVAGASSVNASAAFLAQLTLDVPVGSEKKNQPRVWDPRFWLWGNLRVGSIAPPANVAGLSPSTLYQSSSLAAASSVVQSIEASGGFELKLGQGWDLQHDIASPAGIAAPPTTSHLSISLIGGVGLLTPLSGSGHDSQAAFFQATPAIQKKYSSYDFTSACAQATPANICYVAFIAPDRQSFFKSWEAGGRFKFYVKDPVEGGWRFPGIIDFTVGRNQYITGGDYNGFVSHTAVVFPLPVDSMYLTLALDTRLTGQRADSLSPMLLPPPKDATPTLTDSDVVPIQIQPDRDRWAIGLSFDIVDFVKKLTPPPASPKPPLQ